MGICDPHIRRRKANAEYAEDQRARPTHQRERTQRFSKDNLAFSALFVSSALKLGNVQLYNTAMHRTRLWLLLLWLVGILFPAAWLGKVWPAYGSIFNRLFAPEWMHLAMHALLFAGLIVLLVTVLRLRLTRQIGLVLLGMALLVGLLQESSQLWAGVQVLRWNSLFDLGIDLLGAGLGLLLMHGYQLSRNNPDGKI
jgi:hypothetical protein